MAKQGWEFNDIKDICFPQGIFRHPCPLPEAEKPIQIQDIELIPVAIQKNIIGRVGMCPICRTLYIDENKY